MVIKDTRRLSPKAQEALRIRSVQAVLDGKKQVDVAEIFGVTPRSVNSWVKTYRKNGFEKLKARKRGRRRGGSLLPWQAAQIAWAIKDKCPDQLHFPFYLWTRESVAVLIESRFEVRLSKWTAGRYLKRWGFTPQKPLKRAYERNPVAVRKWQETDYPTIHRQAKKEKALIYWGDEMGIRSDHAVGRTYGKRGHTPVIETPGKRFSCNMVSAITNMGHLNFMVFQETFNARVFIEFMRRLIRQSDRKVYLILDNLKVHHSKMAMEWVKAYNDDIGLFFLPAYAPELNPDERLNQDVKSNADNGKRAHDAKQMIKNIRSYLRMRQCQPDIVRNYFLDSPVLYAA